MIWVGLFAIVVAVAQAGVVVTVSRRVAEIREWATRWGALAETQKAHEVRLRYLHSLVNPLARSTGRPWPRHLQETK